MWKYPVWAPRCEVSPPYLLGGADPSRTPAGNAAPSNVLNGSASYRRPATCASVARVAAVGVAPAATHTLTGSKAVVCPAESRATAVTACHPPASPAVFHARA